MLKKNTWIRDYKIMLNEVVIGKVIFTRNNNPKYLAEIIISNSNYISKLSTKNGIIDNIVFSSYLMQADSIKELNTIIDNSLVNIFGSECYCKRN